jgi:hypothetical protein
MDSLLVEALVETRRLLDDLGTLSAASPLRLRRDLLERAACGIHLRPTPKAHVIRIAKLVLAVRDEAVSLHHDHRVVVDALTEVMD